MVLKWVWALVVPTHNRRARVFSRREFASARNIERCSWSMEWFTSVGCWGSGQEKCFVRKAFEKTNDLTWQNHACLFAPSCQCMWRQNIQNRSRMRMAYLWSPEEKKHSHSFSGNATGSRKGKGIGIGKLGLIGKFLILYLCQRLEERERGLWHHFLLPENVHRNFRLYESFRG